MTDKDRLTNPHSHILMNQDILHSGKEEVLWDGVYSKDVLEEMVERLAEYEDTSLTPDEIIEHEEMLKAYRHVRGGKSPGEIERLQSELTAYKSTDLTPSEIKSLLSYGECGESIIGHCNMSGIVADLKSENTRLKAERDKAVSDLKTINYQDMTGVIEMCKFCKYGFDKQCTKCDVDTLTNGFEWKGLEESE